MDEIKWLFNQRWVLKRQNEDQYYRLKDNYKQYKDFLLEKLGYQVTINPLLVKLDKVPGTAEPWMGIQAFTDPMSYTFFCLILMFLEEKDPQEQFVLSQLTAYLDNHYPKEGIVDWTLFFQRKLLIQVLTFAEELGILAVTDGSIRAFEDGGEVALLYENTGVSKYFMRHFQFDVHECQNVQDLQQREWDMQELDRGIVRRHRVYRKLMTTPVVYEDSQNAVDADYLYIKNQRGMIEGDIEKALGGSLHVHKQGALVLMHQYQHIDRAFPDRRMISDIVLQFCAILQSHYKARYEAGTSEYISISMAQLDSHLSDLQTHYSHGWGKTYRELAFKSLKKDVLEVMQAYGMIKLNREASEVMLLPMTAKFSGQYPDQYIQKRHHQQTMNPSGLDSNEVEDDQVAE